MAEVRPEAPEEDDVCRRVVEEEELSHERQTGEVPMPQVRQEEPQGSLATMEGNGRWTATVLKQFVTGEGQHGKGPGCGGERQQCGPGLPWTADMIAVSDPDEREDDCRHKSVHGRFGRN